MNGTYLVGTSAGSLNITTGLHIEKIALKPSFL